MEGRDKTTDVELERLLNMMAQEFSQTDVEYNVTNIIREEPSETHTQNVQQLAKEIHATENTRENTGKENKQSCSMLKSHNLSKLPLHGLSEWEEVMHTGLATSEACSEILRNIEKAILEMENITASVQNEGNQLSQNASFILVREAKLQAVKEELERVLTHFRHMDDLVHEAHDPMLSTASVRFATLIEGLHNELIFLSAHRNYKSTPEYATKLADAQERVTACLIDALTSSFETALEVTRSSNAFSQATELKDRHHHNVDERDNDNICEEAHAVRAVQEHNNLEKEQEEETTTTSNTINFPNNNSNLQHTLQNDDTRLITNREHVVNVKSSTNNENESENNEEMERAASSAKDIYMKLIECITKVNSVFTDKLNEKASLRRMFEMRVSFQSSQEPQSKETNLLLHRDMRTTDTRKSSTNATNDALNKFMENNVSEYTNTTPLYIQTVCHSFIAIRVEILREILHAFVMKYEQQLRALESHSTVNVVKKSNAPSTNNAKMEEKNVDKRIEVIPTLPMKEAMHEREAQGQTSASHTSTLMQPEDKMSEEELQNDKNYIVDNSQRYNNKRNSQNTNDNLSLTNSNNENKSDTFDHNTHFLSNITHCLIKLLYLILSHEEELLTTVWLREEMVKTLFIPQLTHDLAEEVYCIYRSQLVKVDDLLELVDAIKEIDYMRQGSWRCNYHSINNNNNNNISSNITVSSNADESSNIVGKHYMFDSALEHRLRENQEIDEARHKSNDKCFVEDNNAHNNNGVSLDSLWVRMIQDTQERIIFRTSVFLRQEALRCQVTHEQVVYYLDEQARNDNEADNTKVKSNESSTAENDNRYFTNTNTCGKNVNNNLSGIDTLENISKHTQNISFHPCVVRASHLLRVLYPVLELSVFAIFAEEAVRLSLQVIQQLHKSMLMYNNNSNSNNTNKSKNDSNSKNNKSISKNESNDTFVKVKALLCELAHLIYLHEELTHIGANITVITKSLDLSKLRQSRLAISESARETKRDVDEALYSCFDKLVDEIDAQLSSVMQDGEQRTSTQTETQLHLAHVEQTAQRIEHCLLFYISNEALRDDILQPVQQRVAELQNSTKTTEHFEPTTITLSPPVAESLTQTTVNKSEINEKVVEVVNS